MRFGFVPTHETHLYDSIISLRVQACSLKTSLTPPLLMKFLYQAGKSECSCISVLGVSILSLCVRLTDCIWNCAEGF